jgi:hypothetical protein
LNGVLYKCTKQNKIDWLLGVRMLRRISWEEALGRRAFKKKKIKITITLWNEKTENF